jgi:hypothetical protein
MRIRTFTRSCATTLVVVAPRAATGGGGGGAEGREGRLGASGGRVRWVLLIPKSLAPCPGPALLQPWPTHPHKPCGVKTNNRDVSLSVHVGLTCDNPCKLVSLQAWRDRARTVRRGRNEYQSRELRVQTLLLCNLVLFLASTSAILGSHTSTPPSSSPTTRLRSSLISSPRQLTSTATACIGAPTPHCP